MATWAPLRRWIVGFGVLTSLVLFVLSLGLEVVQYERVSPDGTTVLLTGWFGLLAWHVGWYANPPLFLSYLAPIMGTRGRAAFTWGASVLALGVGLTSFLTLARDDAMFGRNEGEGSGAFVGFGPGIFVWTAALVVSVAANRINVTLLPQSESKARTEPPS